MRREIEYPDLHGLQKKKKAYLKPLPSPQTNAFFLFLTVHLIRSLRLVLTRFDLFPRPVKRSDESHRVERNEIDEERRETRG